MELYVSKRRMPFKVSPGKWFEIHLDPVQHLEWMSRQEYVTAFQMQK